MSFRPVFGRSSAVASSMDQVLVLLVDLEPTTAWPSSSSTVPMSPTCTPGDAHGLALAGGHGLRVGELDLER